MKKLILMAALLPSLAFAFGDSTNYNAALAGSSSGSQSNSGANSQSANAQSITFNSDPGGDVRYSGEVQNVPNALAPNVYPTSPCSGASSAAGSAVGFGLSVGTSWTDKDCSIRETARSFATFGMMQDAVAVLCTSEFAKSAPSCSGAVATPAPAAQ